MRLNPQLLVLVRHAESARNAAKASSVFFADDDARGPLKSEADHDTGLTEAGCAHARAIGIKLRQTFGTFDRVFNSGYRRTRETTEGIAQAWPPEEHRNMVAMEHLWLRERDGGYTFNMTASEAEQAFPWLQDYWSTFGPFVARPPGGESLADVATRVRLFLDAVAQDIEGRRVLVVTHGGTLRMFRYWLEGWSPEEVVQRWKNEPVPNGSSVAYRLDAVTQRLVPTTDLGDDGDLTEQDTKR